MRPYLILILFIANLPLLHGQGISENNDPKKYPTLTNKFFVEEIKGRPIDFYLKHQDIGLTAKMFYKGEYAIFDDDSTFSFLDSVLTKNVDTKPFYFFIYNQVMKITDGSISEYMAGLCRQYLEKYPCEFLTSINDSEYQVDIDKWTAFIGFDIYDSVNYSKFVMEIDKRVRLDCAKTDWEKVKIKIKNNLEEK